MVFFWGGREEDGAVVFDETQHGFAHEPDIYRALFEFPLALATLSAVLSVALLLWASMARFGTPQPERPPIEPGKGFLIANIAELLLFGGYTGHVMKRYKKSAMEDVARRLHVPAKVDALERNAEARDLPLRLTTLDEQVRGGHRPLRTAQRIHRWREEMIHGRGERT